MQGGSIDLRTAPEHDVQEMLKWYRKNFETIGEGLQTDLFEEFLRQDAIHQQEGLQLLDKMEPEQLRQIGLFIGNNLDDRFVQLFWSCWITFDEATQASFIQEFIHQKPELIIMVAPFINLRENRWEKIKEGGRERWQYFNTRPLWRIESYRLKRQMDRKRNTTEFKNLLGIYFNDFASAKKLVENLLAWTAQWDRLWVDQQIKDQFEIIITMLGSDYPIFLMPYVPQLMARGLIREELAGQIYQKAGSTRRDFFITKQEASEVKDFYEKDWQEEPKKFARHQANHLEEVANRYLIRTAQHALANFADQEQFIEGKRVGLLLEMLDGNIPVMVMAENLKLTLEEIHHLIEGNEEQAGGGWTLSSCEDLISLLDYAKKMGWSDKVERWLINKFGTDIAHYGQYTNQAIFVAKRIELILEHLSDNGKKNLIKMINTHAPALWFNRIDWAIKNQAIDLRALLYKNPDDLIRNLDKYYQIIFHLRQLSDEEKQRIGGIDRFRTTLSNLFHQKPDLIFDEDKKQIVSEFVSELFDQSEIEAIIAQGFTAPIDYRFIGSFLATENLEKRDQRYLEQVKQTIIEQPSLINKLIIYTREGRNLLKIFSATQIIDLMINSGQIDLENLINYEFIKKALQSPKHFEKLLNYLIQTNPQLLPNFYQTLEDVIQDHQRAQNKLLSTTNQKDRDYYLKKLLSPQVYDRALDLLHQTGEALLLFLEKEPVAIFDRDVLGSKNLELGQLIATHLDQVTGFYPEAMANLLDSEHQVAKLDPDIITKVLYNRRKSLAFLERRYETLAISLEDISQFKNQELTQAYLEFNPYFALIEQKELTEDFYNTVMAKVRDNPFYEFYKEQLQQIIDSEHKHRGLLLKPTTSRPNQEFIKMINRISLLKASPLAGNALEKLKTLGVTDREEIFSLLEYIAIYNLDSNIDPDLEITELKQALMAAIVDHTSKVFEIEFDINLIKKINIDTLQDMATYYRKVVRKNPMLKETFLNLLRQVLAGDFTAWRAWNDGTNQEKSLLQLKEQQLLPSNLHLDQYRTWTEDEKLSVQEVVSLDVTDLKKGIRSILGQAIADEHIDDSILSIDEQKLLSQYDLLKSSLVENDNRLKQLKDQAVSINPASRNWLENLEEIERLEFQQLKQEIAGFMEQNREELLRLEALIYLSRLGRLRSEELQKKIIELPGGSVTLQSALRKINQFFTSTNPAFLSDIERIGTAINDAHEQIFGSRKTETQDFTATDKVEINVYFKIGAEPVPSCQHFNEGAMAECLLAYVVDPGVKIIQLYDQENKLIARSVIRLLEDQNGQPALFLERIYSSHLYPQIKKTIITLAKQKAQKMGIKLYSSAIYGDLETESEQEPVTLFSRNSRTPYVYTDAGGGVVEKGLFKIGGAAEII